ncbi:uncharacterized protein LOC134777611 [Penaeus indicus]|uniref:uncharacterized protein LOC134777611 n=1 Tax=Penaeus indicus TaxID=29960 RepID=UPI00300C41E8
MELNAKKTKVMAISRKESSQIEVHVDSTELEQVKKYKYLGSIFTENGKCEEEIRSRMEMAKNVFYQHKELIDCYFTLQTKIKILSLYILPVAAYESECWTVNKEAQRRITAFEMWCLRRMLRISWKDKVKNVDVLEKANIKDRWLIQIARRKMKFARHVLSGSAGDLGVAGSKKTVTSAYYECDLRKQYKNLRKTPWLNAFSFTTTMHPLTALSRQELCCVNFKGKSSDLSAPI